MLTTAARTGIFALALATFAPCAMAQAPSDADIGNYLKSRYAGLTVADDKRIYEGALDPLKEVIVVTFSLAYPTARDFFKSSEVEALTAENGHLKSLAIAPLPIGQVDTVSVRDGAIHVLTKTIGKDDKPCCPTEPHSFVYRISDDLTLRSRIEELR